VACALEWADTRFDRTVAMINPANATSISVARRCGFSIFGEATYKAEPVGLWERLRSSS
jgi:RimJ/RimL family protein N-acetyltransferase